jgi:hypothetical protein
MGMWCALSQQCEPVGLCIVPALAPAPASPASASGLGGAAKFVSFYYIL